MLEFIYWRFPIHPNLKHRCKTLLLETNVESNFKFNATYNWERREKDEVIKQHEGGTYMWPVELAEVLDSVRSWKRKQDYFSDQIDGVS